ncbi:hypothetical protein FI667_g10972, partial [Globisporangium splendens]
MASPLSKPHELAAHLLHNATDESNSTSSLSVVKPDTAGHAAEEESNNNSGDDAHVQRQVPETRTDNFNFSTCVDVVDDSVVISTTRMATAEDESVLTTDNAFAILINLFLVFLLVKVVLVVRWLTYWVIVAELLTFAVTGSLRSIVWVDRNISDSQRNARRNIIISLIVAELLTLVFYIATHYVYLWAVRKRHFDFERWWNVTVSKRPYSFTYRSLARFYKRRRAVVSYCGGLDAQGQPHGFGIWSDSSFHGEQLRGQWEHGLPVGPFQSQEQGSGETRTDKLLYIPKHSVDGLHWGVARCSVVMLVSSVQSLEGSEVPQNAAECLPILRTPLDEVRAMDETSAVRSFNYRENVPQSNNLDQPEKEALVFLHGYNCPLDQGLTRFAQLLALGNFPSHFHPYVFSWPTGGVLAYYPDFLASLVDAGYSTINIIAHSMGARIYFECLNRGLLDDIFCDGALFFAEVLTRKAFFDPLEYSMGKRVDTLHRDHEEDDDRAVLGGSRWSTARLQHEHQHETLELELAEEAAEKNQKANFPNVVAYAYSYNTDVDLDSPGHEHNHTFLDIDVIDTTWMDNNVHYIRHSYFNLNPTVIDDIRQIVVHKRRARFRSGLTRTAGNIHIFLVAPSFVKN